MLRVLLRRALVAFFVIGCVVMAATVASAKLLVTAHGRSLRAQAQMDDAAIVIGGNTRLQILSRLCADPSKIKGCEALKPALRRALEDVLNRPVTWVSRRPSHGPTFVVIAPVAWTTSTAKSSYAWWGTKPFSCSGGGSMSFRQDHGSWTPYLGSEYVGCPAS